MFRIGIPSGEQTIDSSHAIVDNGGMTEETTRQFLARLWELQADAGLKNSELATILGCTPSYIRHMKAGRKGSRIGLNIALAAARRFPELRFFLSSDFPVGNTDVLPSNEGEDA